MIVINFFNMQSTRTTLINIIDTHIILYVVKQLSCCLTTVNFMYTSCTTVETKYDVNFSMPGVNVGQHGKLCICLHSHMQNIFGYTV